MTKDVDAALCQIIARHGVMSKIKAREIITAMQKDWLYARDAYSDSRIDAFARINTAAPRKERWSTVNGQPSPA